MRQTVIKSDCLSVRLSDSQIIRQSHCQLAALYVLVQVQFSRKAVLTISGNQRSKRVIYYQPYGIAIRTVIYIVCHIFVHLTL